MSTRYEWISLSHPFLGVQYVEAGHSVDGEEEAIGAPSEFDHERVTDVGAIVVFYDEAVVIEGTQDQLKDFALRILEIVPDDNPTGTVLRLADQNRVTVNYQDRSTVEAQLGRELTDEEWDKLWPFLDNYDEWMDNGMFADDTQRDWLEGCLRDAGITDES